MLGMYEGLHASSIVELGRALYTLPSAALLRLARLLRLPSQCAAHFCGVL